ncbi:MAG: DUF547 domain-containing protein [Balneola sp.]|nr:MAG: DUF547 domain-containing protein [Balneola sp.]
MVHQLRKSLFLVFIVFFSCQMKEVEIHVQSLELSSELLLEVKRANSTDSLESMLASFDAETLQGELNTDTRKKAFWLNIYNAWYQIVADRYSYGLDSVFVKPLVPIAGDTLSFDEMEHAILRKKPGYDLNGFAVDSVDFRIHFALNCGAKSCPPIAFYDARKLDTQLEAATKLYLTLETDVDDINKEVRVTQLMEWFSVDFGGEEGIILVLNNYLEKDLTGYTIKYKTFDWTQQLENFLQ